MKCRMLMCMGYYHNFVGKLLYVAFWMVPKQHMQFPEKDIFQQRQPQLSRGTKDNAINHN